MFIRNSCAVFYAASLVPLSHGAVRFRTPSQLHSSLIQPAGRGVCIPTPPPRGVSRWIPETLTFQSGALKIAALWKCYARRQDAKNLHKRYGLLLLFAAPVDQKQESALPAACRPPPPAPALGRTSCWPLSKHPVGGQALISSDKPQL